MFFIPKNLLDAKAKNVISRQILIRYTMIIGVPKEIKNNENRVGLTPAGVAEFKKAGHQVYVQSTAGEGSGFPDADYRAAGAEILPDIQSV